jgi:opacity protein-like surface antigen
MQNLVKQRNRLAGALTAAAAALAASSAIAGGGGDWSGAYGGVGVGYGFGTAEQFYPFTPATSATNLDVDIDGALIDAHLGYRHRVSGVLLGVEAALGFPFMDGSATQSGTGVSCRTGVVICQVDDLEWLTTIGGSLGFGHGRALFYAGGGYAGTDIETSATVVATGANVIGDSRWHGGWYAGVGAALKLSGSVSLGVDYKYVSLSEELHGDAFGAGNRRLVDPDFSVVQARLDLHF